MTIPTPPRRFRFGLRTLFVLVTVACMGTAWVTYSLNWIRQRHQACARRDVWVYGQCYSGILADERLAPPPTPNAPGGLWLFGEEGFYVVFTHAEDAERAKQLFPEARVIPETPDSPEGDNE